MSAKYNIVCEQGTTFNFQFVVKNDSTPWNLTGYSATMTIKAFVGATTSVGVASTANGLITFDAVNGRVIVSIPAATTLGFSPARNVYDLILTSGGGTVTRILEGKFVVTGGVTV